MQNAGLDEAQAGIQIVGKNINNLRHADDTTLMAESKEKLKSLLRKVTEESEKVGLKLNILGSSSITSWQINGETMKTKTDFIFLDSKITAKRSNPRSKEWLHGPRRAERSYSTFKVRRGSHEEIPLVQGKEQPLHFAGAAMKRYPTCKVRETQVRW